MVCCSIRNCKSRGIKGGTIRFFTFPQKESVANEWLRYCRPKTTIKNGRVCSKHFLSSDYFKSLRHILLNETPRNARALKPDALPTLLIDDIIDNRSMHSTPMEINKQIVETSDNIKFIPQCTKTPADEVAGPSKIDEKRCEIRQKYCLPDGEWFTKEWYQKLYSQNKVLCNRHFKSTSLMDYPETKTKLHRGAVPFEDDDKGSQEKSGTSAIELPREGPKESDAAEAVSEAKEFEETEPVLNETHGTPADKYRPVKQVLQLRLIEDVSVCDEPLYEVLTDDESNKEVDKKQTATQTDIQNTSSSVNGPPSKESYVQSAPITTSAESTTPTCDKYTNKEYWKLKLKHILHNTQFCGVCLEADIDMKALSHVFDITEDKRTWSTSLADIVHKVFREGGYWPANSQICNNCTKKIIQSYIFICNAEETSRMLERHLDELYTKTCYVRNKSLKDANSAQQRIHNVVIALDNKVISQNFESNKIKIETPEPVQSERGQIGDKRKLRCVSCNVVVRSYRAWRRHERTAHKQSVRCRICLQSYKTQRALTTHYRTHLRSRCPFCHRTVRDGGLLQHLKTRHKHSIHSCTTCNVALYSAEALGTHIEECHRREGSKCVTCLQSLSRVELERHQCRFKCPECEELPCVHHRHLMWYREQMGLDPGPRAKCADCRYVASSKQALLAHVNATHLSQQSLRCARCGQHFYRRAHLDKHVCASGRGNKHLHECRYCGKAFSNLYMWKRHEKHCKDIQRRYQCDDCPANFDSTKDHMIHRKLKHGKDFLLCRLCDRVFLNDLKRTRHERQAHGEQRGRASLVCAACHTEFSSKAALELHMRYHGAEVMDQLDSLGQLKSHKHRRRRSFAVCEVCGAVMRRILLKKHMKGHSMATVSCKTCGKSFQSPTLLRDHQSVHARTASCPRCNKVISSAKLWRHFRNHLIRDSLNVKVAAIHAL